MGEIGVGLVGLGAIAAQHRAAIARTAGIRLAGAVRRNPATERSVDWGAEVPMYASLTDLLRAPNIDAVAICTPSNLHASQAIAAIEAGKHVLIEKPVSLSLEDADAIAGAANAGSGVVAVVSQRRFEPVMRALRDAVAQGALGRLIAAEGRTPFWRDAEYYRSPWRGTVAEDGGTLMNQGIHIVDLLLWIAGRVDSVAGFSATLHHATEADDTTVAAMRFRCGAMGTLIATTAAYPGAPAELWIAGDRGQVRVVGSSPTVWEVDGFPPPGIADAPAGGHADPTSIGSAGHEAQYADFVQAVVHGRTPAITLDDGRAAVELVLAVQAAARDRSLKSLP